MVEDKKFRIAEIFGPTVQGEGRQVGLPCHFVRFGGCDYRCRWCDSPQAVLPDLVAQLPQMNAAEILQAVKNLTKGPKWVVLSGGNPALFDLALVTAMLQDAGYSVMVETQGSRYNSWLQHADEICVSPKPPSAGGFTTPSALLGFLNGFSVPLVLSQLIYLKIVIFTDRDYRYAQEIHKLFPELKMWLSVGTPADIQPTVGDPNPKKFAQAPPHLLKAHVQGRVCQSFMSLAEKVARDPEMNDVAVLPQLHVLAWGTERGH